MTKPGSPCRRTIILCGGKGTRLGELGESMPKPLVELHGRSILYHKLSHSISQGFRDFIVAIGYKGNMIVDACKDMDLKFNVDFTDSGEDAGMLRRIYDANELFEDRVIVTYGDSISNIKLQCLIDFHLEKGGLLSIVNAPIQSPFGLVTSDDSKQVQTLEEKPVLHYYIGAFSVKNRIIGKWYVVEIRFKRQCIITNNIAIGAVPAKPGYRCHLCLVIDRGKQPAQR